MNEKEHWKDRLIAKAEAISDGFDVAKAYGAHIANWVLFFCLVANLVEMISPEFQAFAGMAIVGVQSISLDVAGFGLTAMAASARRRGDRNSAIKADVMGWTLISVMAITVGMVTLAAFKHEWAEGIEKANQVLMFVRVIVTVFYGHIVHQIREAGTAHENRLAELETQISDLQKQISDKQQEASQAQKRIADSQKALSDLQIQLNTAQESARIEVESLRGKLEIKGREVEMMQTDQAGVIDIRRELNTVKFQAQDLQAQLEAKQQTLKNEQLMVSNLRREVERLQQNEATMRIAEAQLSTQIEALRRKNEAKTEAKNESPKQSSEAKKRSSETPAAPGVLRLPSNADRAAKKAEALRLIDEEHMTTYKAAEITNIPAGTIQRWLSERKNTTQGQVSDEAREA